MRTKETNFEEQNSREQQARLHTHAHTANANHDEADRRL